MSSTTHNLPYTRFTRQVRTEPQALLATDVAAANALTLLKSADWAQRSADETEVTFPARSAVQDGFNPLWDAFKHVGNYSAGYQRAYAGMVAYRFQVPADALTTNLATIAVPLNVDRWLVDGVRVAAYASDSVVPSSDWDTLRTGDVNIEGQLPMTYTEDDPPRRIVVEKSDTLTLTFSAFTPSKKYLYVIVSLEDYTTTRGFWIEGASLIQGQNTVTTFAAAVTADPDPATGDYAKQIFTRPHLNEDGRERSTEIGNTNYSVLSVPTASDTDLLWMTSYIRSSLRNTIGSLSLSTKSLIAAEIRRTDGLGNWRFLPGNVGEELISRMWAVSSTDYDLVVYRRGSSFYCTNDFFETEIPIPHDVQSVGIVWNDDLIIINGSDGCFYTMTGGDTWFEFYGIGSAGITATHGDDHATASPGQLVVYLYDTAATTEHPVIGVNWRGITFFGSGGKVCAVSTDGDAYVTTDGGTNWAITNESAATSVDPGAAYGIISPQEDVIVYMYYGVVGGVGHTILNISTDAGATWSVINTDYVAQNNLVDVGGGAWGLLDADSNLIITEDNGATFRTYLLQAQLYHGTLCSFGNKDVFMASLSSASGLQRIYTSDDITKLKDQLQVIQSLSLYAGGIIGSMPGTVLVFDEAIPAIPAWMSVQIRVYAHSGVISHAAAAHVAYESDPKAWYNGQDIGSYKHLASIEAKEGMTGIGINTAKLDQGYHTIIVSAHIDNIHFKPDPFAHDTWYGLRWEPRMLLL